VQALLRSIRMKQLIAIPKDIIIRDKNRAKIGYTFVGINVPFIELVDKPNPVLLYDRVVCVQALLRSIRMKQLIAIPKVDLLSGSYKII
jgi:hypothetical protein